MLLAGARSLLAVAVSLLNNARSLVHFLNFKLFNKLHLLALCLGICTDLMAVSVSIVGGLHGKYKDLRSVLSCLGNISGGISKNGELLIFFAFSYSF